MLNVLPEAVCTDRSTVAKAGSVDYPLLQYVALHTNITHWRIAMLRSIFDQSYWCTNFFFNILCVVICFHFTDVYGLRFENI